MTYDKPLPNMPTPPWWHVWDDAEQEARYERTITPPYWLGEIDEAALQQLMDAIGVEGPVALYAGVPGRGGILMGLHKPDFLTGAHQVYVRDGISAVEANRILRHELTHAMQLERDKGDHWKDHDKWYYPDGSARPGYEDSPKEREANAAMDLYQDINPLIASAEV